MAGIASIEEVSGFIGICDLINIVGSPNDFVTIRFTPIVYDIMLSVRFRSTGGYYDIAAALGEFLLASNEGIDAPGVIQVQLFDCPEIFNCQMFTI